MYKDIHETEVFAFRVYSTIGDYAVGTTYGVELPHVSEVASFTSKEKVIERLRIFIAEAQQCLDELEATDV